MKKIFTHLKSGLLLAMMMIVCAANVKAEEITVTLDMTEPALFGYEKPEVGVGINITDIRFDGILIETDKGTSSNNIPRFWGAKESTEFRIYSNNTMTFSADGNKITNIVFTGKNLTCIKSETGSYSKDTWTGESESILFNISGGTPYITSIVVTYIMEGEAAAVSTPSFSVRTGTYYEPQSVEIECATAGAEIYYTMDGTEPTADSYLYDEALVIDETTTVKAIAIKGSDVSKIAEATYTIKEYTKAANIAEFIATNTTEANGTEPVVITNPVTVLFQNGIYLFVKDESGFLQIYGSIDETYNNGDIIPAGIRGTVGYYGKRYQMVPAKESFKAGAAGTAIEPTEIAISEISAVNHCELVKVKKVTVSDLDEKKNFKLTCGSETLAGYNRFNDVTIPTTDDEYTVTGILNEYNGNMQLFPIEFTVTTSLDAAFVNSSVITANGAIRVNAEENGSAVIVNALGQIVANATIKEGENTFNVAKGLYIVKANGKTTKVLVK